MVLGDLLKYDCVTIQCHDNPDADAIASGFGIYRYMISHGKNVKLIYCGTNRIQKVNLLLLVQQLNIPIEYIENPPAETKGLLITVDCQYGEGNVTKLNAEHIAIIDHHQRKNISGIEYYHVASELGSCSTLVWKLLKESNYRLTEDQELQTALYYGLYSDTCQFTDIWNPTDKDMRDELVVNEMLIRRLQNSNINSKELEIAGIALIRTIINREHAFAVVHAEKCDPNILGFISDLVLQVNEIDMCIVYCINPTGIKFSVRTCVCEHKANHIAAFVSEGLGSGGGHITKAGGYIELSQYYDRHGNDETSVFFANRLKEYAEQYDIVYAGKYHIDVSAAGKYEKKRFRLGYVKATDVFESGISVLVRTMEGDIHMTIRDDLYFMIGIKGEVYPIDEIQFRSYYEISGDEKYDMELLYSPKVKAENTKEEYYLLENAKVCYSNSGNVVLATQLKRNVKVFTRWDSESYTIGKVGDYLVCKENDLNDVYVIENDVFNKTYKQI